MSIHQLHIDIHHILKTDYLIMDSALLTWLMPCTLNTILTKKVNLGLIRPQVMVPVIHVLSLLVFSELFLGFLR